MHIETITILPSYKVISKKSEKENNKTELLSMIMTEKHKKVKRNEDTENVTHIQKSREGEDNENSTTK